MPAGLQVWDSMGKLILGPDDWVGRIIGSQVIGSGSGSFGVAGFSTGTPFAIPVMNNVHPTNGIGLGGATTMPTITISGTTLYWVREITPDPYTDDPAECTIYYGVY